MPERAAAAAVFFALAFGAAACGGHSKASTAIDWGRPAPADRSTARLVTAQGSGAHRLALWRATNRAGDLCVGWRLGGGGAPARYSCQRRGLERPLLWVQGGGGTGERVDWGGDVGLVAPGVTRVTADGRRPRLLPVPGLPGWRAFAEGGNEQPASALEAYDAGGRQLVEDTGLWINAEGDGCACTRTASGWSGTHAYVPEQERGDEAHAVAVTLAQPGVRDVLQSHRAWVDLTAGWQKCTGGRLGLAVDLKLWRQATFRATLPFKRLEPSEHVAYVTGVHRVLAVHSDDLLAWVDTSSWQVVGVETAFGSGMEIPLGTVAEPKPGGGYDDMSACPQGD